MPINNIKESEISSFKQIVDEAMTEIFDKNSEDSISISPDMNLGLMSPIENI